MLFTEQYFAQNRSNCFAHAFTYAASDVQIHKQISICDIFTSYDSQSDVKYP